MNVDLDADLNDRMTDAARPSVMRTVSAVVLDGAGMFSLRHSSTKQSAVFVMSLDNKN